MNLARGGGCQPGPSTSSIPTTAVSVTPNWAQNYAACSFLHQQRNNGSINFGNQTLSCPPKSSPYYSSYGTAIQFGQTPQQHYPNLPMAPRVQHQTAQLYRNYYYGGGAASQQPQQQRLGAAASSSQLTNYPRPYPSASSSIVVPSAVGSQQHYYGLTLPPSSYPQPSSAGDYGPYGQQGPFGQGHYQLPPPHPSQWAAYQQQQQQGMYPQRVQQQQQMRPPTAHYSTGGGGGQQIDDEQRHQQGGPASTSRLSASSTPAPLGDQRPISRASSAVGERNLLVDQQQQGAQQQQEEREAALQRQTQTPSSAFSANAPTPPLTTSTAAPPTASSSTPFQPPNSSSANSTPAGPSAYYPPGAPYGARYPPGGELYGSAMGAPPGMYPPLSQQPLWGSYTQQQHRYQQQLGTSRSYQQGSASTSTAALVASPQQQPQHQKLSSKGHHQQQQQQTHQNQVAAAFYGAGRSGGGGPPPGMLPAAPISYSQQQHQTYMASSSWHSSITAHFHQFPPGSLEAQTIAQVQQQTKRRRDKIYARDLCGATPTRIVMALRSALHTETIWALNALNVQLYDDTTSTNPAPSLAQMPELLNLLVDHLTATLTLLFPKHFKANTLISWRASKCPAKGQELTKNASSSSANMLLVPKREVVTENGRVEVLVPHLMVRAPIVVAAASARRYQQQNNNNNNANFTLISRLGRRVKLDTDAEMPPALTRELKESLGCLDQKDEEKQEADEEAAFPHFLERIRKSIQDYLLSRRQLQRRAPLFKKRTMTKKKDATDERGKEFWESEEEETSDEGTDEKRFAGESEEPHPRLFFRRAHPWELWGTGGKDGSEEPQHFSLIARPAAIQDGHADEMLAELVEHCLALANVLRGYVFLPGQEKALAQHQGLLGLLPALIMLMVGEADEKGRSRRTTSADAGGDNHQCSYNRLFSIYARATPPPAPLKKEEELDEAKSEEDSSSKMKKAEENDVTAPAINQQQRPTVAAERDSRRKWLLEVANQLRDDAFVIMAQLSAQLDLFDMDNALSWSIFDALLYWCVSNDLQARDPLPPFGTISPRHYAMEILCKMSVLERNVDLLCSTGPWPRLEAFVRLLCAQICEEPPVREFAIVILNAMCTACEPACYVAAVETPLLEHLVSFLEAADANMTQIVQQQGMHALRENPEIIGTSVGMLRRATTIMVQIAKHKRCREHFNRLQHRLLQFTVSHFMDLRVAAMVANILFETQRGSEPAMPKKFDGERASGKESLKRSADDKDNGKFESDNERKNPEFHGPTTFSLGSDSNALFNGVSANGEEHNNTNSVHSTCSSNSSAFLSAVPPITLEVAPDNGNTGNNGKNNNRKRPHSGGSPTTSSSQQQDNNHHYNYEKWNGHGNPGGMMSSGSSFESVDEPPLVEKRPRAEPPTSSLVVAASSEQVRERMRNNILSKASYNNNNNNKATSPQKKNGWIAAGTPGAGGDDGGGGGIGGLAQHLHNGTTTEANKGSAAGGGKEQQSSPVAPATAAGGTGGSLTVVA